MQSDILERGLQQNTFFQTQLQYWENDNNILFRLYKSWQTIFNDSGKAKWDSFNTLAYWLWIVAILSPTVADVVGLFSDEHQIVTTISLRFVNYYIKADCRAYINISISYFGLRNLLCNESDTNILLE